MRTFARKFDSIFFLAPFELKFLAKMKNTPETVFQQNIISWNFIVKVNILCTCAYSQEILI